MAASVPLLSDSTTHDDDSTHFGSSGPGSAQRGSLTTASASSKVAGSPSSVGSGVEYIQLKVNPFNNKPLTPATYSPASAAGGSTNGGTALASSYTPPKVPRSSTTNGSSRYSQNPPAPDLSRPRKGEPTDEDYLGQTDGQVGFGEPQASGYKDLPFAVLFVFAFVSVFVVAGAYHGLGSYPKAQLPIDSPAPPSKTFLTREAAIKILDAFLISCLCSLVFSSGWLYLAFHYTYHVIVGCMVLTVSFCFLASAACFALEAPLSGALLLVMGLLFTAFFFFQRRYIPFAVTILQTVISLVHKYPATIAVAFGALASLIVFMVVWVVAMSSAKLTYASAIYLLFVLFWTTQVIKNVVHVTVVGGFASWYFASSETELPSNPTLGGLRRALTTSFGSICFGSLIVATLKTLRVVLQVLYGKNRGGAGRGGGGRATGGFLGCCMELAIGYPIQFLLECFESFFKYFNKYSYVQVGVYGKSFCESAKQTWFLMHTAACGQAVINDTIVAAVTSAGVLLGALINGCLCGGYVYYSDVQPAYAWVYALVLGLTVGFVCVNTVMEVVSSGVATLFVCWTMESNAIQYTHPELYAALSSNLGTSHGL